MGRALHALTSQTAPAWNRRGKNAGALPSLGQRVGRYTVLSQLGAGGVGVVYLASDPQLRRRIALKLMVPFGSRDDRLLDEARALARLQHPNVVAVHDVGWWDDRLYLAMEYVEGVSLDRWLYSHPNWRERLATFEQAGLGLAAAHRAGVVHHDVKPSNIMVGNDGRARLVDFGLARTYSPDATYGLREGTPRYMSPEQRRGTRVDARTDQFSFCIALYEALFAAYPFPGATLEERDAAVLAGKIRVPPTNDVPVALRDAIIKGLACEPEQRHATMETLLAAMSPPRSKRRRRLGFAAAAVVAMGATGAMFAFPRAEHDRPMRRWDAILAASSLAPEVPEPLTGDPLRVTVHRLSNGLTVYISPSHDRPRIDGIWRFHVGTADAPGVLDLARGFAKKGTERLGTIDYAAEKPHLDEIESLYRQRAATSDANRRAVIDTWIALQTTLASVFESPNEYIRVIDEFGGGMYRTASTADETTFEFDLSSNRFDAWADLEADRWSHPVFRMFRAQVAESLAFKREQQAQLENRVHDAQLQAMFAGDRYARSNLRDAIRVIQGEPFTEVAQLFRERFVPNNAELVLVGDLDPVTAIPVLERAFASWEPRPQSKAPATRALGVLPAFTGAPSLQIPSAGETQVRHSWLVPARNDPDTAALEIVDELLLRAGREVAPGIELGHAFWRADRAGMYTFLATPGPTHTADDAERALEQALARIRGGEFPDDWIDHVKRSLRVSTLVDARDNRQRIASIAREPVGSSWRDHVARETSRERVTRADVIRVARRILDRPHLTTRIQPGEVVLDPIAIPPVPPTRFADQRSKMSLALVERDVVPLQSRFLAAGRDYEQRVTRAGRVVVSRDRKSELFNLDVIYDVGEHEIPLVCASLVGRMSNRQASFDDRGIKIDMTCDERWIIFTLTGLDEDLPHATAAFDALFADLSDEDWAKGVAVRERDIVDARGCEECINQAIGSYALYGRTSPALAYRDATALHAATRADGAGALATLRSSERSFGYFGPRSIDELVPLLPARSRGTGATPRMLYTMTDRTARVVLLDAPELSNDAHVSLLFDLGAMRLGIRTPDYGVFDEYWGSSTSPLLKPLHGIGQFWFWFQDPEAKRAPWLTAFNIITDPSQAAAVISRSLVEIVHTKIDPKILERAKASWDEWERTKWMPQYLIPQLVLYWYREGQTADPRPAQLAALPHTDLSRVTAAVRRAPRVIAIWGNLKGIDRAALSQLGTIQRISIDDLFRVHPVVGASALASQDGGR